MSPGPPSPPTTALSCLVTAERGMSSFWGMPLPQASLIPGTGWRQNPGVLGPTLRPPRPGPPPRELPPWQPAAAPPQVALRAVPIWVRAKPPRLADNRLYFRSCQETRAGSGLEIKGSEGPTGKKGLLRFSGPMGELGQWRWPSHTAGSHLWSLGLFSCPFLLSGGGCRLSLSPESQGIAGES